jgi:hypothetical protein
LSSILFLFSAGDYEYLPFLAKNLSVWAEYHTKEIFMKKRPVLLAMLVMILAFGLMVTACPEPDPDPHTHSYSATWSKNATQHWHECSCGDKADVANHTGDPCTVCGYDSTHVHSYSATWFSNATQHWRECSCGDKTNVANHTGNPCTVCGYSSGDDGAAYLGNTLELSGQVYLLRYTDTGVSYENFNGNRMLPDYYGGSDEVIEVITSGNLDYSVGIPDELEAFYDYYEEEDYTYNAGWSRFFDEYYDNVAANNASVRGLVLDIYYSGFNYDTDYSYWYWSLRKENETASVSGNSSSGTTEWVRYVYVNNDVTVSGTGTTKTAAYTDTWENGTTDNAAFTYTYISKNLNLALKAGWNAIYFKSEWVGTFTGTFGSYTNCSFTHTLTMSLKNPSLRWVLSGWGYDDYDEGDDSSAPPDPDNNYPEPLNRSSMLNAPEKGKLGLGGFEQRAKQAAVK